MSKEVHRFNVVKMLSEEGNKIDYKPHGPAVVLADAYDALLAERDAMKALLVSSREFVAVYVNSSFFGPNARKQLEAIDAALQGVQP